MKYYYFLEISDAVWLDANNLLKWKFHELSYDPLRCVRYGYCSDAFEMRLWKAKGRSYFDAVRHRFTYAFNPHTGDRRRLAPDGRGTAPAFRDYSG